MSDVSKKIRELSKKQRESRESDSSKMMKRAHIITAYKGLQQLKKRLQG